MSTDPAGFKPGVRKGWVIGCSVAGVMLVAAAYLLEWQFGWEGVSPTVLVNLGTSIGLAGVIFWLGGRFTSAAARSSDQAAHKVAEEVEERAEEREKTLTARLDGLQALVEQRMQAQAASQDEMISRLLEEPTFDNVTRVFTKANALEAFDGGSVTVHASDHPNGVALTFRWQFKPFDRERPSGPHLDIEVRSQTELDEPGRGSGLHVEWMPEDEAVGVAEKLTRTLQSAGRQEESAALKWELALSNLQRSFDVGISARRGGADEWRLNDPLVELVDEEWAITAFGLECPPRDIRVPGARIVHDHSAEAARPDWVDVGVWTRLVQRGRKVFPRTWEVARPGEGRWMPWTRLSTRRR